MVKLKRIYAAHISTSHITKHKLKNLCFASQLIYVRHRWYSDTHFFLTNVLLKFHLHRLLLPFSFITLLLSLIYLSLTVYIYTYTYMYLSLLQTMSQIRHIYMCVFIYVTYIYVFIYVTYIYICSVQLLSLSLSYFFAILTDI